MLLFVRAFYAEGKTSKPLIINALSTVVTILLGFLLIKMFHSWQFFANFTTALMKTDGSIDPTVLMLPLAFTLGTLLNLWLHWRSFAREYPGFTKPVMVTMWHSLSASIIGGYAAYLALGFFGGIFGLTTVLGVFMQGFLGGIVGIAVTILILHSLKSPEFHDIARTFREKIWKVDNASLDKLQS